MVNLIFSKLKITTPFLLLELHFYYSNKNFTHTIQSCLQIINEQIACAKISLYRICASKPSWKACKYDENRMDRHQFAVIVLIFDENSKLTYNKLNAICEINSKKEMYAGSNYRLQMICFVYRYVCVCPTKTMSCCRTLWNLNSHFIFHILIFLYSYFVSKSVCSMCVQLVLGDGILQVHGIACNKPWHIQTHWFALRMRILTNAYAYKSTHNLI